MESEVNSNNQIKKQKFIAPQSMIDTRPWNNLNIPAPDGTVIIETDQTDKNGRKVISE